MNQIATCKQCTKRKFDPEQGIVCSLTNEKPAFEDSCPDFVKDETIKQQKKEIRKQKFLKKLGFAGSVILPIVTVLLLL